MAEKIIGTSRIYDGKIVNLRVDDIELQNGKTGKREIVEHHGAVAIVPLYDDGSVVLVRQYRLAAARYMLEIPAGTIETGDDPEETAHRELAEEVHLQAASMTRLYQSFVAPGYSTELIHTYLARELTAKSLPGDEDEFLEILRIPLLKAIEKIDCGEIEDSKSIAGLLYVHYHLGKAL